MGRDVKGAERDRREEERDGEGISAFALERRISMMCNTDPGGSEPSISCFYHDKAYRDDHADDDVICQQKW